MKVDFKDYITNHCDYCAKKGTVVCGDCIATNDYIATPSRFLCTTKIGEEYFHLLEDHTKMLYNMGFKIVR